MTKIQKIIVEAYNTNTGTIITRARLACSEIGVPEDLCNDLFNPRSDLSTMGDDKISKISGISPANASKITSILKGILTLALREKSPVQEDIEKLVKIIEKLLGVSSEKDLAPFDLPERNPDSEKFENLKRDFLKYKLF